MEKNWNPCETRAGKARRRKDGNGHHPVPTSTGTIIARTTHFVAEKKNCAHNLSTAAAAVTDCPDKYCRRDAGRHAIYSGCGGRRRDRDAAAKSAARPAAGCGSRVRVLQPPPPPRPIAADVAARIARMQLGSGARPEVAPARRARRHVKRETETERNCRR